MNLCRIHQRTSCHEIVRSARGSPGVVDDPPAVRCASRAAIDCRSRHLPVDELLLARVLSDFATTVQFFMRTRYERR